MVNMIAFNGIACLQMKYSNISEKDGFSVEQNAKKDTWILRHRPTDFGRKRSLDMMESCETPFLDLPAALVEELIGQTVEVSESLLETFNQVRAEK